MDSNWRSQDHSCGERLVPNYSTEAFSTERGGEREAGSPQTGYGQYISWVHSAQSYKPFPHKKAP